MQVKVCLYMVVCAGLLIFVVARLRPKHIAIKQAVAIDVSAYREVSNLEVDGKPIAATSMIEEKSADLSLGSHTLTGSFDGKAGTVEFNVAAKQSERPLYVTISGNPPKAR